jgi:hypothetical protein
MSGRGEQTTLYLRGMPSHVVREAKARAARRGATLAAIVTDALARSFDKGTRSREASDREFESSMAWYEANRARLVRRYENEFIAIAGRKVVDHDRDFERLAARVFRRHGVRPIFMPRVRRIDQPARLRSPRITRQ